jgi:TetR/AcrR family transcriptional regulator, tetracycline repressor protein
VDTEGVAALIMRRLARESGVEATTLYHHFPNKEAILEGHVPGEPLESG